MQTFTIPANGTIQIPSEGYTFRAPEGTLLALSGVFDHPSCGIRAETNPGLDTENAFTVNTIAAVGLVNTPMYITSMIPPQTPPGVYVITQSKEWPWIDWARIYLFNSDSIPHMCIGYTYTMALLKTARSVQKEEQ